MTKTEIIKNTVKHYMHHERALKLTGISTECVYLSSDGARCAHSIRIKDEVLEKIVYGTYNVGTNASFVIAKYGGDSIHLDEFQGHSVLFWNSIQALHDLHNNWVHNPGENTVNHLTHAGELHFEELLWMYHTQ